MVLERLVGLRFRPNHPHNYQSRVTSKSLCRDLPDLQSPLGLLSIGPLLQPKSFKLIWRCPQLLSGSLAKDHVHRCQLMIRAIMKLYRGLCSDLLAFTSQLRKLPENLSQETVDEGCTTSHRLKCVPLLPNEICRITQYVRVGEGRKKGRE